MNDTIPLKGKLGELFNEFCNLSEQEQDLLIVKICEVKNSLASTIISHLGWDKYEVMESFEVAGHNQKVLAEFDTDSFPHIVFDSLAFSKSQGSQIRLMIDGVVVAKSSIPLALCAGEIPICLTCHGTEKLKGIDVGALLDFWSDALGVRLIADGFNVSR